MWLHNYSFNSKNKKNIVDQYTLIDHIYWYQKDENNENLLYPIKKTIMNNFVCSLNHYGTVIEVREYTHKQIKWLSKDKLYFTITENKDSNPYLVISSSDEQEKYNKGYSAISWYELYEIDKTNEIKSVKDLQPFLKNDDNIEKTIQWLKSFLSTKNITLKTCIIAIYFQVVGKIFEDNNDSVKWNTLKVEATMLDKVYVSQHTVASKFKSIEYYTNHQKHKSLIYNFQYSESYILTGHLKNINTFKFIRIPSFFKPNFRLLSIKQLWWKLYFQWFIEDKFNNMTTFEEQKKYRYITYIYNYKIDKERERRIIMELVNPESYWFNNEYWLPQHKKTHSIYKSIQVIIWNDFKRKDNTFLHYSGNHSNDSSLHSILVMPLKSYYKLIQENESIDIDMWKVVEAFNELKLTQKNFWSYQNYLYFYQTFTNNYILYINPDNINSDKYEHSWGYYLKLDYSKAQKKATMHLVKLWNETISNDKLLVFLNHNWKPKSIYLDSTYRNKINLIDNKNKIYFSFITDAWKQSYYHLAEKEE